MSTRVYRTLLLLYPRWFRLAYGEDMVNVFQEMRREQPGAALWWRVTRDACTSIVTQRMESFMSRPNSRLAGVLSVVTGVIAVTTLILGGSNPAAFFAVTAVAALASGLCLIYWRNNRGYVEPAESLHQKWAAFFGGGVALLVAAVVATNVLNIDGPWELLIADVLLGWGLAATGVVLGVWHAAYRIRSLRTS